MTNSPKPRARRPRGSLTTEAVVEEALRIIDRDGLDELSMPRLARSLGCGAMTIYGYVADKNELLDLVAARVFQDVEIPELDEADWQEWMREWIVCTRAALLAHPQVARLLAQSELKKSPFLLHQLEHALCVLERAGFTPEQAVRATWTLVVFVLGYVQWEVSRTHARPREDYVREWRVIVAGLPDDYKALPRGLKTLETVADDAQFEYGLDVLLRGVSAGR